MCPSFSLTAPPIPGGCKSEIIDTAGADRSWITSDGNRVWISYHDAGNSSLIHVQRSDDDGFTWTKVGNPVVAQGENTGNATFNNDQVQSLRTRSPTIFMTFTRPARPAFKKPPAQASTTFWYRAALMAGRPGLQTLFFTRRYSPD